jgi:hypothetical protein
MALKIQQRKPKFLIPKSLRGYVFRDTYRYERYFETEVDRQSAAGLFGGAVLSEKEENDEFSRVSEDINNSKI